MDLEEMEHEKEEGARGDDDDKETAASSLGESKIYEIDAHMMQEPLYRPLLANEIRILEVLPPLSDSEDDDVYCLLKCTSLENPTEYNALSYTWGDPTLPKVTIIVDGHNLKVTENCKLALQELRREVEIRGETQTIWIDAICINQEDISERSQQVQLMRKVYWNCRKLVIWLGPEAEGTKEAIEIIADLDTWATDGKFDEWVQAFITHPRFMDRFFALMRFFSLSWFRRVWVIQEFATCHQKQQEGALQCITIYCGEGRISPEALYQVRQHCVPLVLSQLLQYSPPPHELVGLEHAKYDFMAQLRSTLAIASRMRKGLADVKAGGAGLECFAGMFFQSKSPLPGSKVCGGEILISSIITSSSSFVTEPRDRVYGNTGIMMGLVEAASQQQQSDLLETTEQHSQAIRKDIHFSDLIFNYSASVEDVYSSAVRYVVHTTHRLDILSLCSTRSDLVKRTWTPDFSCLNVLPHVPYQGASFTDDPVRALKSIKDNIDSSVSTDSNGLYTDSLAFRVRHASFRASRDSAPIASFSDDLSVLSVEGICVASIDVTFGHHASRKPSLEDNTSRFDLQDRASLTALLDMLVSKGCYKTYEAARTGFCNMFIGGMRQSQLIEAEHIDAWPSWVGRINARSLLHSESQSHRHAWNGIVRKQRNRDLFFAQPLLGDTFPRFMFGKCYDWVEIGDLVCVIMGCDVPLVIRPVDDHYEIVGDCCIDGLMEGQAMEFLENGEADLMTFDLH